MIRRKLVCSRSTFVLNALVADNSITSLALAQLCEFIEDCEFTKLSVRILHLIGVEGPKAAQPSKYIRYIYNRVVLENAIVRAAAVSALAKFGVNVGDETVKSSIRVLLTRYVSCKIERISSPRADGPS